MPLKTEKFFFSVSLFYSSLLSFMLSLQPSWRITDFIICYIFPLFAMA
uniref:Uncharacterized protein n=1 Tax=Rhizophora mucronata TaxID=61149 RepID=A0A2P2QPI6_RHIMU